MSSFSHNRKAHRFELLEDGLLVFAAYQRDGEVFTLLHVETDPDLRGCGAAGRLMQKIAELARQEGCQLRPVCSYAIAWFKRHPNQADLLAQ